MCFMDWIIVLIKGSSRKKRGTFHYDIQNSTAFTIKVLTHRIWLVGGVSHWSLSPKQEPGRYCKPKTQQHQPVLVTTLDGQQRRKKYFRWSTQNEQKWYPSTNFLYPLYLIQGCGELGSVLAGTGQEAKYTLDRSAVHRRATKVMLH